MKPLANVAAITGTAEVIQAESQLWSIIKIKFSGNHKLPHGPVSYNFFSLVLTFHFTIKQDFLFKRFYVGGEAAEVYWRSNGYHRGGYAYRLCKVHDGQYWKVTEECFQQGHLNFSGRKYRLFELV